VSGPGGVPSYTTHTNALTYSFPQQGSYDISVVGNHSAGAFAAQRHLTAEGECEASTCNIPGRTNVQNSMSTGTMVTLVEMVNVLILLQTRGIDGEQSHLVYSS